VQGAYLAAALGSLVVFSEVSLLSLQFIHLPGLKVLVDAQLSKLDLVYQFRINSKIDEPFLAQHMKMTFLFKTLDAALLLLTYRAVFSKTGFSVSFCMVHMIFMVKSFRFISWFKELDKYRTFLAQRKFIQSYQKQDLSEVDEGNKEFCAICMNELKEARILPCDHKYH
jgi:hypothetical protein